MSKAWTVDMTEGKADAAGIHVDWDFEQVTMTLALDILAHKLHKLYG